MKKSSEILKNCGFYCKNKDLFTDSEKQFFPLMDDDFFKSQSVKFEHLPCNRDVNNFMLYPCFAHPFKKDDYSCVWYIIPKNSPVPFFFTCLKDAESFARHYTNDHSTAFWNKLYEPLYSFLFCRKYVHF